MKGLEGFNPSIGVLSRTMRVLIRTGGIGKTALAQKANVNYARFLQHLQWLENKHLVELTVREGRVQVKLTEKGRDFATTLSDKD